MRRRSTISDMLFFALGMGCYALAFYAQRIMPRDPNWSFRWEYANFLMDIAAGSSFVLFIAGMVDILRFGRKCAGVLVMTGTEMTGILPILMFFFTSRWLQANFA
jgi:hypothetical protein